MKTGIISASGRIARGTFWLRWAIAFVINIVANRVAAAVEIPLLGLLVALPVSIFIIIQAVKRVHDVDKPGWYIIIPIYNIILYLTPGTAGPNQYGADPSSAAAPAKG